MNDANHYHDELLVDNMLLKLIDKGLYYLYYLLENGWSGKEQALLKTADVFISEELLPWVSDLNCRLQKEASGDFYLPASLLLILLLKWIAGLIDPL